MRKAIKKTIILLIGIYAMLCGFFYFFQEKLIFYPQKLDKNFVYNFKQDFEESNTKVEDGVRLNSLIFKADSTKGLIFFLHGNAGALNTWGNLATFYTDQNYDILFFDYRGFGKSDGKIDKESQLFNDVQELYNIAKKKYEESKIIIIGYSIGTGPATYLASKNDPKALVLLAPYYSLTNVIQSVCPILPEFLIKYKFETYKYIIDCNMPIYIFHGNLDQVIDYNNSLNLSKLIQDKDSFRTIEGIDHNNILESNDYKYNMITILGE